MFAAAAERLLVREGVCRGDGRLLRVRAEGVCRGCREVILGWEVWGVKTNKVIFIT